MERGLELSRLVAEVVLMNEGELSDSYDGGERRSGGVLEGVGVSKRQERRGRGGREGAP